MVRQENRKRLCADCAADECKLPAVNTVKAPEECRYFVLDVGSTGLWKIKENVTNSREPQNEPDRPLPGKAYEKARK